MKCFPDPIDQPRRASGQFSRAGSQCYLLWRICHRVEQLSQPFCLRQAEQLRTIVLQSKRHWASARRLISAAGYDRNRRPSRMRRGQSLVEFAVVALVVYMLLAAILTFGHALYVAQGLQMAADLGAREISRTPLGPNITFEDALNDPKVQDDIYSEDLLVFDLETLGATESFFQDVVPTWPVLNQQLATLMIVDRPDFDGDGTPDRRLLRYPGALLSKSGTPTGFTVGIPIVVSRAADGVETIRWVPVVEEIDSADSPEPFQISSPHRGIVALRINYPFQSASMSSFRENAAGPFEPTLGSPNAADDGGVSETNPEERPGDLIGTPLLGGGTYADTYGGQYGLGAQGAIGSEYFTGSRPVRPYRRVISAQAIYRREVFE